MSGFLRKMCAAAETLSPTILVLTLSALPKVLGETNCALATIAFVGIQGLSDFFMQVDVLANPDSAKNPGRAEQLVQIVKNLNETCPDLTILDKPFRATLMETIALGGCNSTRAGTCELGVVKKYSRTGMPLGPIPEYAFTCLTDLLVSPQEGKCHGAPYNKMKLLWLLVIPGLPLLVCAGIGITNWAIECFEHRAVERDRMRAETRVLEAQAAAASTHYTALAGSGSGRGEVALTIKPATNHRAALEKLNDLAASNTGRP